MLERTFAVNTFGLFLLTQASLSKLLNSCSLKVCTVQSQVSSIADNSSDGKHAYRASKPEVNSIERPMAMVLGRIRMCQ